MQTIAHNLSNVNTTGYKRQRPEFQDLMYQTIQAPGANATSSTTQSSGIEIGLGSKVAAIQRIFSQGSSRQTGRDLDVMIEGNGFLRVNLPDGSEAYTRAGSLEINESGELTTVDGDPLADGISIPENNGIFIGKGGIVSIREPDSSEVTEIGQIQFARFSNQSGTRGAWPQPVPGNHFFPGSATVGNPGEDGFGRVEQGFLELSNVEIVDELVNMITAQRAYEINSRSISTSDEMMQTAVQLKR